MALEAKKQTPPRKEPLLPHEWDRIKEFEDRCQDWLDWEKWLHKATLVGGRYYTGPSVWQGLSLRRQLSIERAKARVDRLQVIAQLSKEHNTCFGCGSYSPDGSFCNVGCTAVYRYDNRPGR